MWEALLSLATNKSYSKHPLFMQAVEHFCNYEKLGRWKLHDKPPLAMLVMIDVSKFVRHEDVLDRFIIEDNVFFLRWWNETFGLKTSLEHYLEVASRTQAQACKLYLASV